MRALPLRGPVVLGQFGGSGAIGLLGFFKKYYLWGARGGEKMGQIGGAPRSIGRPTPMKPAVGLKKLAGPPLLEVRTSSAPWPRLAKSSTNEVGGNWTNQSK